MSVTQSGSFLDLGSEVDGIVLKGHGPVVKGQLQADHDIQRYKSFNTDQLTNG